MVVDGSGVVPGGRQGEEQCGQGSRDSGYEFHGVSPSQEVFFKGV